MIGTLIAICVGAFAGAITAIFTIIFLLVWPIGDARWKRWEDRHK